MPVGAVQKRNHKACFRNALHFLDNPLREERSGGPSIEPEKRMKDLVPFSRFARSSSSRTNRPTGTPVLRAVLLSQSASSSGRRIVIVLLMTLLYHISVQPFYIKLNIAENGSLPENPQPAHLGRRVPLQERR